MAGLSDSHIVEKSKSLVWAKFKDYGTGELKILDTYLSRINARDPDSSFVTFSKREYAELMGIDPDIRTEQLKTYTSGLLSNVVTIDLPGRGYVQYPLFSEAKCEKDEVTGQVTLSIDCNPKLKQVFFDIARDGYVRYQLKNVISLRSQYSIRLYTMLKDRPFGWTVEVDDLRKKLGATAATYETFKRFNGLILKKAIEEINTITDITVEAEPIRKGRTVASIKFTVKEKQVVLENRLPSEEQMALDDFIEADHREVYEPDDPLAMTAEALPPDFSRDQVKYIRTLATEHVPYEVATLEEKNLWIYEYLQKKVEMMRATKDVRSPYGWLCKAVAENW